MLIDNVKTLAELDSVMDLVFSVFPYLPTDDNKYSLSFWAGKMNELPSFSYTLKMAKSFAAQYLHGLTMAE